MNDFSDSEFETGAAEAPPVTRSNSMPSSAQLRAIVANAVFYFGIVLTVLSVMDLAGKLPARMPHFWYPVRLVWPFVGMAICYAGHRMRDGLLDWAPQRLGQRFHTLILYTRQDCHLCDVANAVLERYGQYLPQVHAVDIDKDAILIAKFTTEVPVVEIDGKVRFKGRVDEILLRRLIEGTPPNA